MKQVMNESKNAMKNLIEKVLMNETQSRRDNLRFLGFPEQANETSDMCRDAGIPNARDLSFVRVHRVAPAPKTTLATTRPRAIIAKFKPYKEWMNVWENKAKFGGKPVHVEEDFPSEIQQGEPNYMYIPSWGLRMLLKLKMDNHCTRQLVIDKLLVNSKSYTVDTLHRLPRNLQPEALATQEKNNT